MARQNPYQVIRVQDAGSVEQLAQLCQRNLEAIEDELRSFDDVMRLRVVFHADTDGDFVMEPGTMNVITGAGGGAVRATLPYAAGNDAAVCLVKAQTTNALTVDVSGQTSDTVTGTVTMSSTSQALGYIAQAGTQTWGRVRW